MSGLSTLAIWLAAMLQAEPDPVRGLRHPALSPDGSRLAFSWRGDLWAVGSDGGVARRLTSGPGDDQKPAWSPDGRRIAFSSDRQGDRDVLVLDLESGALRTLTIHSADDDAPAWSPDGRWIAFHSNRESNVDLALNDEVFDVWKAPAGGGTAVRVTRFRGENPAWSPDGRWIAYDRYSTGYGDGEHNIFVVDAEGAGPPREIAAGPEDSRRPVWRGASLLFSHEANGIHASRFRNIWRAAPEGGPLFQVTGHRDDQVTWPTVAADLLVYEFAFDLYAVRLSDRRAAPRRIPIRMEGDDPEPASEVILTEGFRTPVWSPDGARLAFSAGGRIWVAPIEGGEATLVTSGPDDDREPAWSPNGDAIVYVSGPSGLPGHVRVAAVDGLSSRTVSAGARGYRFPRFSPDGTRIMVTAVDGDVPEVGLLDAGTGAWSSLRAFKGVEEAFACFSPDGAALAWLARADRQWELRAEPLAGGETWTRRIDGGPKEGLAWSPDGRRLAYATVGSGGKRTIRALLRGESDEVTLAEGATWSSWSPDSARIVAEVHRRGADGPTLAVFDGTGKDRGRPLAIRARREVPLREEMGGLFQQVWSSYYQHYYDPFFHGLDMPALRERYAPIAAACRTKPELYDLLNDMIRELDSSHVQLRPSPTASRRVTGLLGADLERNGDGTLTLRRLVRGGPAARAGLSDGDRIVAVAGRPLTADADLDAAMTGPAELGPPEAELRVRQGGRDRTLRLRGLERRELRELKYARWIEDNERRVRERSGGRLAYFHIRRMSQDEVARLREEIERGFGGAKGLVFDDRDGIGGLAHRPVCALLDGGAVERLNRHPACVMRNRNGSLVKDVYGSAPPPRTSWNRPVVMVQNEVSRSDKEILPYTFRHLGIGYLVGMPTAGGVIGGSEWTMRDGSRIVVSVQGWFTIDGRNMEGWGVPPDFRVPLTHADQYAGRDPQLDKAVDVLLAQMEGRIAPPSRPDDR